MALKMDQLLDEIREGIELRVTEDMMPQVPKLMSFLTTVISTVAESPRARSRAEIDRMLDVMLAEMKVEVAEILYGREPLRSAAEIVELIRRRMS